MTNYMIIEKSYSYNGELKLGKELNISIRKKTISVYNLEIQKVFITHKVYKKYLKLLKLVNFYLASDDDTGTAYHEALNEIEKFRQLVKNKYRAYLLDKELREMSLELTKKVKNARKRLMFIEFKSPDYVNENNRSK